MQVKVDLQFFAVRSKDGKWLRAKGYSGSGESWVTDISKAKIYGKIGPARAQVTFWSKHYPEYKIPEIVRFNVLTGEILNEEDRVKESIRKKKIEEENRKARRLQNEIKYREEQLEIHKQELKKLKTK